MSKKVIAVIKQDQLPNSIIDIEIIQFNYGISLLHYNEDQTGELYVREENRTTVAKAIDPEYQKVIDQNDKLVEALEGLTEGVDTFCKTIPAFYSEESVNLWHKRREAIEALQNTKNIEGL